MQTLQILLIYLIDIFKLIREKFNAIFKITANPIRNTDSRDPM